MDYKSIMLIDELRCRAKELGFKVQRATFGNVDYAPIALVPDGDELPSYARDANIRTGTVEQLLCFMDGMEHMTRYYKMINLIDEVKVKQAEQKVRSRILFNKLKSTDG